MAVAASRAEAEGPSGFSLASIRMASFGKLCTRARASIGSVTMRNASAADAAADRLRNERRDAEGRLKSLAITHLVGAILPQEPGPGRFRASLPAAGGGAAVQQRASGRPVVPPERRSGPWGSICARAGWPADLYEEDRAHSRVFQNPTRRFLFLPTAR